jgi:hypothetical protein
MKQECCPLACEVLFKEIKYSNERMDWTEVSQDSFQWQAVMNTTLKLRVP